MEVSIFIILNLLIIMGVGFQHSKILNLSTKNNTFIERFFVSIGKFFAHRHFYLHKTITRNYLII